MSYDYSSESKLLELPNPFRLQNRLLWLCTLLLIGAGLLSLWWARDSLQTETLRLALAPLLAGLLLLAAGIAAATTAARRLRFFFGRGRPKSLAPDLPPGVAGKSAAADRTKEILRQGGLTYPEPQGAIEGLLYHWMPTLITAPIMVQHAAQRGIFNLAAIAATAVSFGFSWLLFGTPATRPWIGILYFAFGAFFLLKPVLSNDRARLTTASLIGLIAVAILGPVAIGLLGPRLPPLGGFTLDVQTFAMLGTALVACALSLAAVLAQVDPAPQTRTSVEQLRMSMNAPPSSLLDELERTLQGEWTERIPNRRYARQEPLTASDAPSGTFAGELFEETQPLPVSGMQAPTFAGALADRRHRLLLAMDLYAVLLVTLSVLMSLWFVRQFDAMGDWRGNRLSLLGNSAILAFIAAFCMQSSARLWGRFNFQSVLVWVELNGSYQTSRIGTGHAFSSRMNTQNDVVRCESMTLRVWRARIESVTFGKDDDRQVTALFSTEKESKALAAHLLAFAQSQSVLLAPGSGEDARRLSALNAGERSLEAPAPDLLARHLEAAAPPAPPLSLHCQRCGAQASPGARYCAACGAPLGAAAV